MKAIFKAYRLPYPVTGTFMAMISMLFMFSACQKNLKEVNDPNS